MCDTLFILQTKGVVAEGKATMKTAYTYQVALNENNEKAEEQKKKDEEKKDTEMAELAAELAQAEENLQAEKASRIMIAQKAHDFFKQPDGRWKCYVKTICLLPS